MKKWKTCIPAPFLNCEYVYPIQQKKVKALVDHLSQNQNVEKIILFGSSVTAQCHIGSDVDIFVKLKKNEYPLSKAFHFVFDLWTNFSVDERMYEEILKKGVIVYDRGYSAS